MGRKLCISMVCSLLFVSLAPAQDREVSVIGGLGHADGEDVSDEWFSMAGASFSARLWRPEIKVDYEHLNLDRTGNLHFIGVGWLIQKHTTKVRPFFQWGVLAGFQRQRFTGTIGRPPNFPPVFVDRTFTNALGGVALSTGFSVDFRGQLFIRPELRWRVVGPGPFMVYHPGDQPRLPLLNALYHFVSISKLGI